MTRVPRELEKWNKTLIQDNCKAFKHRYSLSEKSDHAWARDRKNIVRRKIFHYILLFLMRFTRSQYKFISLIGQTILYICYLDLKHKTPTRDF